MFSSVRALIQRGDKARDNRDWLAAKKAYGAALRRQPGLVHIWVQYGHALKESGLVAEGLSAYLRADALSPNETDTHIQIGRAFELLGDRHRGIAHLSRASALSRPNSASLSQRPDRALPPGMPERLRFLNLGTTGTCNASCVHCPTGKAETAHVPRGMMPMSLFEKIIDGIVEYNLPVTDQIAFGLFGDALVDPLVVKRASYLREKLPDVRLSINTNGASFNVEKHAPLHALADTIALHCESLEPATYNHLMHPLRLERVMPKFEQIMQTFPGKVVVSVPISTRNRDEALSIRQWFQDRGARDVVYDALSSRCAEDRTVFERLALNPKPIRCPSLIMDDLIVDCDGYVLICCQDFQRIEGIGSMMIESFVDVLTGAQRHNIRKLLAENRHTELVTCSRCFADIRGEFMPA